MSALVTFDGLTKSYKTGTAVDDLTFHVPEGQVCGLLGPNGAGKTTVVRILSTLLQPDAGEVLVDGTLPRRDGEVGTTLSQALDGQAHVYQAQGMVMVELGVSLAEALARMRAHAWSTGQDLTTLAGEIVAGRAMPTRDDW